MTCLESSLGSAVCPRGTDADDRSPSGSTESFSGVSSSGTRFGRKSSKKPIQFTLMVVGASGAGRSTFVDTLGGRPVLARKGARDFFRADAVSTVAIEPTTVELEEEGIKLCLTVVDTPGFGDTTDNEKRFDEILQYIEAQFDEVLAEESRIKRNPKFRDNRVHALLYFILPTGHLLREMDVKVMKRLALRVNVIPVIGRADMLTQDEVLQFKKRIMEEIARHEIPIYDFPFDPEEDDEEVIEANSELKGLLPFAIFGAENEFDVDGRKVLGRKFPWGIAAVENEKHCDFSRLRRVLLNSHFEELKSITDDVLYENYRTEKLSKGEDEGQRLLQEEHLDREAQKLREQEAAIAQMETKRLELLAREEALRNLEQRLSASQEHLNDLAR